MAVREEILKLSKKIEEGDKQGGNTLNLFTKRQALMEQLPSFHEIKIGQQKFYEYEGRGSDQSIYMRVFPIETKNGTINAFCVEGPDAGFHYYFPVGEKVSPV